MTLELLQIVSSIIDYDPVLAAMDSINQSLCRNWNHTPLFGQQWRPALREKEKSVQLESQKKSVNWDRFQITEPKLEFI